MGGHRSHEVSPNGVQDHPQQLWEPNDGRCINGNTVVLNNSNLSGAIVSIAESPSLSSRD